MKIPNPLEKGVINVTVRHRTGGSPRDSASEVLVSGRCPAEHITVWGYFALKGAPTAVAVECGGEFGKRALALARAEGFEPLTWHRPYNGGPAAGRAYPVSCRYILDQVWREMQLDERL